jgi:proline iminopeptidase
MSINYKDKYLKYKDKYLRNQSGYGNIFESKDLSYKKVDPFNTNFLDVGDSHKIYYEEYGNKDGIPFLFIHGGPGNGVSDKYSSRFDLSKIYLIGFDQRGAGRSIPSASITNNTTKDLIEDIEKLRKHLNIKKWYLF